MTDLHDELRDIAAAPQRSSDGADSGALEAGEMRAALRNELVDLTRQLSRLETVLDDVNAESPAQRRARARASLLAILDRLS